MDNELSNTFYEVQAEKFYQKKVEVARGVIELGQILIETKEKLPHGSWIKWLSDSRVNFTERQAQKYMRVYKELGNTNHQFVFDQLSLNKLYTLASAPEEVKEEVANSKDKEEAEKKIKEYERQLKEEKLAKDVLIKNNQQLQEQLEKEKKTKKVEVRVEEREVEVIPNDYNEIKSKYNNIKNTLNTKDNLIKTLQEDLKNNQLNAQQLKDKNSQLENELREIEELKKEKDKLLLLYGDLTGKTKEVKEITSILFTIQKMTSEILRLKAYTSIFEDDSEFVIKNPCKIKALEIINTGLDLLTELKEEIEPRDGSIDINKNDFVEVNYEY